MIKAGIAGADSKIAGELIRILVNHPDVDIIAAEAPNLKGISIAAVHHGLIGETDLCFSSRLDLSKLDVLFLCGPQNPLGTTHSVSALCCANPELRVIGFPESSIAKSDDDTAIALGLSEMGRKPLVRGARHAMLVDPIASIALIGLYPLANHMLLNAPLALHVDVPSDLDSDSGMEIAALQIASHLSKAQSSFSWPVTVFANKTAHTRATRVYTSIACSLAIEEVMRLYNEIYDDHNFTFIVGQPASGSEVSGTQKCIISLQKHDSSTLNIDIVADCRMRGGAGDAVHVMNLLFGLHEKVGLTFKAAKF